MGSMAAAIRKRRSRRDRNLVLRFCRGFLTVAPNHRIPPKKTRDGGGLETRQQRRAECRKVAWWKWRCFAGPQGSIDQAPRDDRGVIPRRTRRSIALTIARDSFRWMGRPGKPNAQTRA